MGHALRTSGLDNKSQATLLQWLEQGATYTAREPLPADITEAVATWEAFLNNDSLKGAVSEPLYL